jgi:hypothetical protein
MGIENGRRKTTGAGAVHHQYIRSSLAGYCAKARAKLESAHAKGQRKSNVQHGENMSEEKSVEPKATADELTKTKKPSDIQLNEEELSKTAAGDSGGYLKVKFSPDGD